MRTKIRKLTAYIRASGTGIISDLLAIAGAVLISLGAWAIYPPAGEIVGGMLCIAAGVIVALGTHAGGDGS